MFSDEAHEADGLRSWPAGLGALGLREQKGRLPGQTGHKPVIG